VSAEELYWSIPLIFCFVPRNPPVDCAPVTAASESGFEACRLQPLPWPPSFSSASPKVETISTRCHCFQNPNTFLAHTPSSFATREMFLIFPPPPTTHFSTVFWVLCLCALSFSYSLKAECLCTANFLFSLAFLTRTTSPNGGVTGAKAGRLSHLRRLFSPSFSVLLLCFFVSTSAVSFFSSYFFVALDLIPRLCWTLRTFASPSPLFSRRMNPHSSLYALVVFSA